MSNCAEQLSVVIPAYNEEVGIKEVVVKTQEALEAIGLDYEILVVDDGSTDNTVEIARSCGATVISHPYNKGYGAALKTGIEAAKTSHVLTLDSDGQHNPQEISRFLDHADEYDMVVGERQRGSHVSWIRQPGKAVLGVVANFLAERKIPDLNSGFRLIRKDKALEFKGLLPDGFSFSTTITLAFFKASYNVKYVPITTFEREGRRSSVRMVRDGSRSLILILRTIVLFNPLKVFLPISLLLSVGGFVYGVCEVILTINISDSTIITFLAGLIIFFFGILADQLAFIRRQIGR